MNKKNITEANLQSGPHLTDDRLRMTPTIVAKVVPIMRRQIIGSGQNIFRSHELKLVSQFSHVHREFQVQVECDQTPEWKYQMVNNADMENLKENKSNQC